jgi:hypothetical protein
MEAVAETALDYFGGPAVSICSRDWPVSWRSALAPHC